MTSSQVFFVYIGERLPAYAKSALKLNRIYSGQEPHLIASASSLRGIDKGLVSSTPLEDFYDDSPCKGLRSQVTSAHNFRDEFWLRTFERLFVLEQFMGTSGRTSLFHAELDQLLFRTDLMVVNLERLNLSGLKMPFHKEESAIASVIHVQGKRSLSQLLNFAGQTKPFMNEMELLARWARANPNEFSALPTLASVMVPESCKDLLPVQTLSLLQAGGLSDAAQLGQWIGGIDPRNHPLSEKPKNHFVDAPSKLLLSRKQLDSITFSLNHDSGQLIAQIQDGQSFAVFNLHIHSKIHEWIESRPRNLKLLIDRANLASDSSIPTARRSQIFHKVSSALVGVWSFRQDAMPLFRLKLNKQLRLRPSSAPFLSGDTFRSLTKNVWDSHKKTVKLETLRRHDVIFVEPELLTSFREDVLNQLSVQVTVILGNSDFNHGSDLQGLSQHPMVKKVFAQNLTREIPNVEILPIGLENRWWARNGDVSMFKRDRKETFARKFRIMWCFSVQTNPVAREAACQDLRKNPSADNLGLLTPKGHQIALQNYAFVASPPGNGLDTHRTWEAMYQGCVPILLQSYLAEKYKDLGLPVWVVGSYKDLDGLSEPELRERYSQFEPLFKNEVLWLDYWKSRILGTAR